MKVQHVIMMLTVLVSDLHAQTRGVASMDSLLSRMESARMAKAAGVSSRTIGFGVSESGARLKLG